MLPQIRIASPCAADWEKMVGDHRVRYCEQCRLSVYNFSAMTSVEIEQLLGNSSGRVCGLLYRRPDGTILTQDCPIGLRAVARRVSRAGRAVLTALLSVGVAAAQSARVYPALVQIQTGGAGLAITATDPIGAIIINASIKLVRIADHTIEVGRTDSNGVFLRSNLRPETYQMVVSAPGFADAVLNATLHDGEIVQVPVKLEIGAPTLGVVVEGNGVQLSPVSVESVIPDHLSMPESALPPSPSASSPRTPTRNFFSRLLHKLGF